MASAKTLLVIGIHREELAFGQAVAAGLDRSRVDVLSITEGLSGRHPRPDQCFHHDILHRALYLQILPHMQGRDLLIDLHTGQDSQAPRSDLYCRDTGRLADLLAPARALPSPPRLVSLECRGGEPGAHTVIPPKIWRNPAFLYVGMEIYLPVPGLGRAEDQAYARTLIRALAGPEGL